MKNTGFCYFALLFLQIGVLFNASAQSFKALHYTETSGYDHQTRQNSLQMFQSLGAANNFTVDNDNDGSAFNSLANLQQYAVVIFSNTSGDEILDATQKANFEAYMNQGGSFLGIHAASDTYRHSTANGSDTGGWDWYAEMLGASVQQNPNHVSGTPQYEMHLVGTHASTVNLPDPWQKNEEYYYWENGYYNGDNVPVLEVEQTIGPNGQANSYDAVRPMSWYKVLPPGGRSFYTALGHAASNYTNDQHFINHVRDALLWCADRVNAVEWVHDMRVSVNITPSVIYLGSDAAHPDSATITVCNSAGQVIYAKTEPPATNGFSQKIEIGEWPQGVYLLSIEMEGKSVVRKFVKGVN